MKRTLLIVCLVVWAAVGSAQQPSSRHSCWDIDIPYTPSRHIPYSTRVPDQKADSGAMLVEYGMKFLGTPYRYGGKTPKGFDCAGYARYLYLHFGHTLPPYSGGQYGVGRRINDTRQLRVGDLVFFSGRKATRSVGHTGIVVDADGSGGFRFIHSAVNGGVIISHSSEPYYKERYIGACRIF